MLWIKVGVDGAEILTTGLPTADTNLSGGFGYDTFYNVKQTPPLICVDLRRGHSSLSRYKSGWGSGADVGTVRKILRTLDRIQRPPRPELTAKVLQLLILKLEEGLEGWWLRS